MGEPSGIRFWHLREKSIISDICLYTNILKNVELVRFVYFCIHKLFETQRFESEILCNCHFAWKNSFLQNAQIFNTKTFDCFFPTITCYEFMKKDANFSFGTNFKTLCCCYETFSIMFLSSPNIFICANCCEKIF